MRNIFWKATSLLVLVFWLTSCGSAGQTNTEGATTLVSATNAAQPQPSTNASGTTTTASASSSDQPQSGGQTPASQPEEIVQGGVGTGSCVERFSPETLKGRTIAFDGTITNIELRDDPVVEDIAGEAPTSPWVTFQVNQWYNGGKGSQTGMWLQGVPTEPPSTQITSVGSIDASVGTRLLVAGEPIGVGGNPEQGIAWLCGFTQPYTAEGAAVWQQVFKP